MPLLARAFALLCSAALLLVGLAPAAAAHAHRVEAREPVFGGLVHERFAITLSGGAVARGNVLRFRPDDPHLHLRQSLARERIPGLETMPSIATRELARDALAGTNGGYWLPDRPVGAPNGL
jgi:hypothetical protein